MIRPLLLCALTLTLTAQEGRRGEEQERSHAQARVDAWRAWYGGEASPDYLDARARIAAEELRRGSRLFQAQPASQDPAWINLGPFSQKVFPSQPDYDGGRITAILPHPTDPHVLYVATQAGLFKCAGADPDAAGDWTWTSLGDTLPATSAQGNISIGALASNPADPRRIYVGMGDPLGSDARGLYLSADGGQTWTLGGGLGSATRTMDILALDRNLLLVGTNAGLWRSTDGGASFANVPLGGATGGSAWSVKALGPSDLVCSRNGNLWYSSDAGATWTRATVDAAIAGFAPSRITLATSPASPTQAWGVCDDSRSGRVARGLLKTLDKGATWTFVPAPTQTLGLFQGQGWTGDPTDPGQPDMPYDGDQGTYNQGLAVDPTDINTVWLGANLALYRTRDGGNNWRQITHWAGYTHLYCHADYHVATWSLAGPKTLYLGTDGGLALLRQPDLAQFPEKGWDQKVNSDPSILDHRRNKGLAGQLIYHLGSTLAPTPADSRYRVTGGLQDNGIVYRRDEGQGLAASSSFPEAVQASGDSLAGDGFGTVIHPANGNLMLGAEQFDFIFKSTDGGATWAPSYSGIAEVNGAAPFLARLVLGLGDPTGNTVYTTANQRVYRSRDFGTSWQALAMGGYGGQTLRNVGVSPTNPDALAIVTSGSTGYQSQDGGATWTQFGAIPTADPTAGVRGNQVSFDTADASTLYLASVALTSTGNHVWRSADRGRTWTPLDSPSNGFPYGIPAYVIQNAPWDRQELFAGTDIGLYRSTDGGQSWSRYGTGLPLVSVRDLYVAADRSFLRIATWGRGIWELPLQGAQAPTLRLSPSSSEVLVGGTLAFAATASDGSAVAWSLLEGAAAGSITAQGLYTAPASPGTYHVVATTLGTPSVQASVPVTVLRSADVDADGNIDVLDLAFFARAFGTSGGASGFDPRADLNGDGQVDEADLAALLKQF